MKPSILPHPTAPEGYVRSLRFYAPSDFQPNSAILCRNTAPLVSMCYALLRRDIPCLILGKDIGKQLVSLVQKMMCTNLEDLQTRLAVWREREVSRLIAQDRSPEKIEDQYACLQFLISSMDENARTPADLCARIDLMFSDSGSAGKITLSSIHKSKGQEWQHIYILDWDLIPSRYAKQPWQLVQERNLQYVAITRSKLTLTYISSDKWKEDAQ